VGGVWNVLTLEQVRKLSDEQVTRLVNERLNPNAGGSPYLVQPADFMAAQFYLAELNRRENERANAVYNAKNGRSRADTEGEGQDGNDGETRRFAQHAHTEVQILYEILNPIYAAGIATLLFAFFDSAHFEECLAARFFQRQTVGSVLFSPSLDMVSQFLIQFLVCLSSAKQRTQPQRNRV
jgi:hypothetical protein